MRNILISIKPEWVEKILNGDKTIEIRKTMPKCELPCKVYVYCTKGKDLWMHNKETIILGNTDFTSYWLNGKVVAEFTLKLIDKIADLSNFMNREYIYQNAKITEKELWDYSDGGTKTMYGWHIDDLKIYDAPKELSEFSSIIKRMKGKESRFTSHLLKRPPQSWCYVEDKGE